MWYYFYNQQSIGPVSSEELVNLIQAGVITNTTLVWQSQQVRQQAGQVPAFALYFKQHSCPQSQPISQGSPTSSPPIQEQRYASDSQSSSTGNYNSTVNQIVSKITAALGLTGNNKSSLFLRICIIAVIVCSLLSVFGTFIYWGNYEVNLSALEKYGYLGYNDTSSSSFSIIFYLLAFLFCIPIVIKGIIQKNYLQAIISVVIAFIAFGYYNYTDISEGSKKHKIEHQLSTKPYYNEVAKLHVLLNNRLIRGIAEHRLYDPDPEELERCAQRVVAEFNELDKYNAQTMEMLIRGENVTRIKFRYNHAYKKYSQSYQHFETMYKLYQKRK